MTSVPTVIGFRAWKVARDARLRSVVISGAWTPGPNRSRCARLPISRPRCRGGPRAECECGLYAYHDVGPALGRGAIHGVVAGWGRTVVHPGCWRAEWAQVLALIEDGCDPDLLELAARRYRVPTVPLRGAEAFGREFGDPVPAELRPARV